MTRLIPPPPSVVAPGAVHLPRWLDADGQRALVGSCRQWAEEAGGLRAPRMPRGGTMSVQITCLGWHWYPYRYSRTVDDGDGRPVARFPAWLGDLGRRAVADAAAVDRTRARTRRRGHRCTRGGDRLSVPMSPSSTGTDPVPGWACTPTARSRARPRWSR